MTTEQILVLANVLSFLGNALFTSSSLFKKKRSIIALQTTNHLLSTIAQLLQQAYSGMVQDGVLLVKNIVLLFIDDAKKKLKLFISILCILTGIIAGVIINIVLSDSVWYGFLPVIAIGVYSTCSTYVFAKGGLSQNKAEVILKAALIFNGILWSIYGIKVQLYPITIFNCLTIVLSIFSIIRVIVSIRKKPEEEEE